MQMGEGVNLPLVFQNDYNYLKCPLVSHNCGHINKRQSELVAKDTEFKEPILYKHQGICLVNTKLSC